MYVKADKLFNDEIKNYDMLVLPGGRPGGQKFIRKSRCDFTCSIF